MEKKTMFICKEIPIYMLQIQDNYLPKEFLLVILLE